MPDPSPAVPPSRIPIGPGVRFERRVTSGVSLEVLTAFRVDPPHGNEVGGILLGSRAGDPIVVTDFEPVLCEYRSSQFYVLSDDDLRGLEESLEWFRGSQAGELQVLGFYRSHARPEAAIDERDTELMRRFFPETGSLFLLLKPGRGDAITAELFVQEDGELHAAGHPMLFPCDEAVSALRAPAAVAEPTPVAAIEKTPTAMPALPPPHHPRRDDTTQQIESRRWLWIAAVVLLMMAAAVWGYRSVSGKPGSGSPYAPGTPAPGQIPASSPAPPTQSPAPQVGADRDSPAPTVPEIDGIRKALVEWARALRSGDEDLIAACYTPEARETVARSATRFGTPAILRISELTVTPVSPDRVIASFRKHWQTGGPKISAGEDQERLTFVRSEDAWKIAAEEETKVYWRQSSSTGDTGSSMRVKRSVS